jgi:transcriptional regulator with XRE-family HTH domain
LRLSDKTRLWLACHTQEQIAAAVGVTHQAISKVLQLNESFRFVANPGELSEIESEERRQEEIAEREGIVKSQVNEICSEFSDLKKANKSDLAKAEYADEFTTIFRSEETRRSPGLRPPRDERPDRRWRRRADRRGHAGEVAMLGPRLLHRRRRGGRHHG